MDSFENVDGKRKNQIPQVKKGYTVPLRTHENEMAQSTIFTFKTSCRKIIRNGKSLYCKIQNKKRTYGYVFGVRSLNSRICCQLKKD
jgi:hypothetical protein